MSTPLNAAKKAFGSAQKVGTTFFTAALLCPALARADLYHYRNMLLGERAAGMGGAFTAISDDPTGVFYNPAGLVWGFENYISVSANTYNIVQTHFKNIIGEQDYTLRSQGLVPSFFGFSQTYGKDKFAFAIMVPDQELLDQDDNLITDLTAPDSTHNLQRRVFKQDTTYMFGPAYARAFGKDMSVGVSLLGFYRVGNAIDNQLILYNPSSSGISKYFIQNSYLRQSAYGISPKLGFQFMPSSNCSIGLAITKKLELGSAGTAKVINTNIDETTKAIVAPNGDFFHDFGEREFKINGSIPSPLTTSLGLAYFRSKSFLVSMDLDFYLRDPDFHDFNTVNTFNVAVGAEWYPWETLALRGGLFTNRADTPSLVEGGKNQALHVDLYGASMGASLIKGGSSFTLGSAYSNGNGQGQVIGDVTSIQPANIKSLLIYLSGSYQL